MIIETHKNSDWIAICNYLNIPYDSTLAMVRGSINYLLTRNFQLENENRKLHEVDSDVIAAWSEDDDEEYWNYTAEDENTEIDYEEEIYDDESD